MLTSGSSLNGLSNLIQVPFADDVRRYTFPSLDNLINRKGEKVTEHPYIPTNEQMDAMDAFVDAMDLMEAGEKDEDGSVPLSATSCTTVSSFLVNVNNGSKPTIAQHLCQYTPP